MTVTEHVDYRALNAMLNLYDDDGKIQLDNLDYYQEAYEIGPEKIIDTTRRRSVPDQCAPC